MIITLLPVQDQKCCSFVQRHWRDPAWSQIFRKIDISKPKGLEKWENSDDEMKNLLRRDVRELSCSLETISSRRFFTEHLPSFLGLVSLRLAGYLPIKDSEIGVLSALELRLKVLTLSRCTVPTTRFVEFVERFVTLQHLELIQVQHIHHPGRHLHQKNLLSLRKLSIDHSYYDETLFEVLFKDMQWQDLTIHSHAQTCKPRPSDPIYNVRNSLERLSLVRPAGTYEQFCCSFMGYGSLGVQRTMRTRDIRDHGRNLGMSTHFDRSIKENNVHQVVASLLQSTIQLLAVARQCSMWVDSGPSRGSNGPTSLLLRHRIDLRRVPTILPQEGSGEGFGSSGKCCLLCRKAVVTL